MGQAFIILQVGNDMNKKYHGRYYKKNKKKMKEYHDQYYKKNRKKLLAKSRLYAFKNREKIKEWHKAWAEKNPEQVLANKRRWRVIHRKINARSVSMAIEVLEKILLTLEN